MEFKTKKELTDTLIDYIKNEYSINFGGYIFRVKSGFTAELNKGYYIKDNEVMKDNFSEKWLLIHTGNGFSNNFNKPKKLETKFCEFKPNWDKIFLMFPTQNGESIELSVI